MLDIRKRQYILFSITLIVLVIATIMLYNLYSSARIDSSYEFNLWYLLLALVFAIAQQLVYPQLSLLALKDVGSFVHYFPMLWITVLSTTANSTVPFPAGIPARAVLQKKVLGVPYTNSAGAIMIETLVSYGCLIITGVLTSFLWLRPVIENQISVMNTPVLFGAVFVGILFTFGLVNIITRKIKGRVVQKIHNVISLFVQTRLSTLVRMIMLTVVSYVLFLSRFMIVLHSVGEAVLPGPLFAAMVFSILAGIASFIPMGLGVRDVSLASLLVVFGVPMEFAAVVVAVDRVLITLPFLIGGVIGTHILGRDVLYSGDSK